MSSVTPTNSIDRLKVLCAGLFSLILMLGVARFAYTPLLPIMQAQTGMSDAVGGWLATFNYIGYMCGALVAASVSSLVVKDYCYRAGIIVALVTTVGMAITDNVWVWSIMRFFAGLSSAAGLLIGSGLIMNWLIRNQYRSELGLHFGGVGLGIAFCAIAVHFMDPYFDWREQWWLLAAVGVLLAIPAWCWLPRPDPAPVDTGAGHMRDSPPGARFMRLMLAAYFCAGYGYVISATFIVTIVEREPGLAGKGDLAFLVVGIAAAPASILWDLAARRWGDLKTLIAAYAIQVVGIILPVLSHTLEAALISAVLYGFTFVGIVSLVLTLAGRFYPSKPAKLMGKMTLAYGVAQIIAPALTGNIAEITGSYDIGLWLASGFMLLGVVILVLLSVSEPQKV